MLIVFVQVSVLPDAIDAFERATQENARQSRKEPGVVRFDVVRQIDDPTRYVLIEVFADEAAPAAHKETAHYKAWRDAVEPMMAQPRHGTKYQPIDTSAEAAWHPAT